jgi:hypothetical protein
MPIETTNSDTVKKKEQVHTSPGRSPSGCSSSEAAISSAAAA